MELTKAECLKALGVDETASPEQITRAFRIKVKQLHPDKNAGLDTRRAEYEQVVEAYRRLKQLDRFTREERPPVPLQEMGGPWIPLEKYAQKRRYDPSILDGPFLWILLFILLSPCLLCPFFALAAAILHGIMGGNDGEYPPIR